MAFVNKSRPHDFSLPPQTFSSFRSIITFGNKSARVKGFNQQSIQQWPTTTSVVVSDVAVEEAVIAAEAVVIVEEAVASAKVSHVVCLEY
jgi:hypothetical protein